MSFHYFRDMLMIPVLGIDRKGKCMKTVFERLKALPAAGLPEAGRALFYFTIPLKM